MATVQDLLDEQSKTDMLITRLRLTLVGVPLGKYSLPTADQMALLHRMQMDSNQRLANLVEQLQDRNGPKNPRKTQERRATDTANNAAGDGGRVSPSGKVWTITHGSDD